MYKKFGCTACEGGEVYFYYKNETNRRLRIESFDCSVCTHGDAHLASPEEGEKAISEREFDQLLENGWDIEP